MGLSVRNEKTDGSCDIEIITTVAISSALSLLAVILRLMSWRIKRVALSYDDYLTVFAWVFCNFWASHMQLL